MSLHAVEIERSVLNTLMNVPAAYDSVSGLGEHLFFADRHKEIFTAIQEIKLLGHHADVALVADHLEKRKANTDTLLELMRGGYHSAVIADHVAKLAELSVRRAAQQALRIAIHAIEDQPDQSAQLVVNNAVDALITANLQGDSKKAVTAKTATQDLLQSLSDASGESTGHATGFVELDHMIGGLESGQLAVVAARPSMGKTAFAVNVVTHIAKTTQKPAVLFSLEMETRSITRRIVAAEAGVSVGALKSRQLDERDWMRLTPAIATMNTLPLVIDDRSALTVADIRTQANKTRREMGELSCIMIDYLQIMGGLGSENRVVTIGQVTSSLKALGKELGCPVIVLSQLSRKVEERKDKRPMMSDLRESGTIEQDADLIMFLYRDEYYDKNSKQAGLAEVIVAKQRDGVTGTAVLGFEGQYSRFYNHVGGSYGDE